MYFCEHGATGYPPIRDANRVVLTAYASQSFRCANPRAGCWTHGKQQSQQVGTLAIRLHLARMQQRCNRTIFKRSWAIFKCSWAIFKARAVGDSNNAHCTRSSIFAAKGGTIPSHVKHGPPEFSQRKREEYE
jgi:hypothetical protein